jgi:hypothetical protein
VCPPQQQYEYKDAKVSRTDELFQFERLASLENCQEGDDRGASFGYLEGFTISCPHASIAMPDSKKVVQD